jgi:hypothetical protein
MNLSCKRRARIKRYAAATAIGAAALAAPAAAGAATPEPASTNPPGLMVSFVPPAVGPISVDIGATILNGKVTSQPVHVVLQPPAIDTSTWKWPTDPKPADTESDSDS